MNNRDIFKILNSYGQLYINMYIHTDTHTFPHNGSTYIEMTSMFPWQRILL